MVVLLTDNANSSPAPLPSVSTHLYFELRLVTTLVRFYLHALLARSLARTTNFPTLPVLNKRPHLRYLAEHESHLLYLLFQTLEKERIYTIYLSYTRRATRQHLAIPVYHHRLSFSPLLLLTVYYYPCFFVTLLLIVIPRARFSAIYTHIHTLHKRNNVVFHNTRRPFLSPRCADGPRSNND